MILYYLLTFKNTMDAIKGEDVLKKAKIDISIMPTPTFITKSCGISIRLDKANFKKALDCIREKKMNVKGIYERLEQGFTDYQEDELSE